MKKKIIIVLMFIMFIVSACSNIQSKVNYNKSYKSSNSNKKCTIKIVDDSGRTIKLDKPAERIISLYSAHTENLFALGLADKIIGRYKSDAYPPQAIKKPAFTYRDDPERIIAAKPDLVLIRPFIEKHSPEFVKTLEKAGINVVSLYPKKFNQFDDYINKIAVLTGTEEKANELLKKFHKQLNEAAKFSNKVDNKVKVFFEATDVNLRTVTPDSMAAKTIEMAGGINIASDVKVDPNGKTSIAEYGAERILSKANEIDVYVSQRGAMNCGGNLHTISIRPGFDKIKAIKNGRVYIINEKLISSPVFRHIKGVHELQRMFYPEIFDDISMFNSDKVLTREKLAKIVVMAKHKPIFAPTSRTYKEKDLHVYGDFDDVDINDEYFDYIETAVLSGYVESEKYKFHPKDKVTRDEFAKVIYMIEDIPMKNIKNIEVKDIDDCKNKEIVQYVVSAGIMKLKNKMFNPQKYITEKEAVEIIKGIKGTVNKK